MPGLLPNVDPDGLLEFSVVYTDRSLNHMSEEFKRVMVDISSVLKDAYNASSAVIVPGSGTFGMEAVARQFANNEKCFTERLRSHHSCGFLVSSRGCLPRHAPPSDIVWCYVSNSMSAMTVRSHLPFDVFLVRCSF